MFGVVGFVDLWVCAFVFCVFGVRVCFVLRLEVGTLLVVGFVCVGVCVFVCVCVIACPYVFVWFYVRV